MRFPLGSSRHVCPSRFLPSLLRDQDGPRMGMECDAVTINFLVENDIASMRFVRVNLECYAKIEMVFGTLYRYYAEWNTFDTINYWCFIRQHMPSSPLVVFVIPYWYFILLQCITAFEADTCLLHVLAHADQTERTIPRDGKSGRRCRHVCAIFLSSC